MGGLPYVIPLPGVRNRRRTLDVRAWWRAVLAAVGRPGAGGSSDLRRDTGLQALDPATQLTQLLDEHADAIFRVALSIVRDHALAEDVTQDSLLKAWQALPTYRGEAPLRNWVLRITHNTAVSTLRRRRDELRDPATLPESVASGGIDRLVDDRFASADFERALASLDEMSRAIVVLREVEGLSYEEIATTLEIPMPTVKTRLLRARRVLAAALSEWR